MAEADSGEEDPVSDGEFGGVLTRALNKRASFVRGSLVRSNSMLKQRTRSQALSPSPAPEPGLSTPEDGTFKVFPDPKQCLNPGRICHRVSSKQLP